MSVSLILKAGGCPYAESPNLPHRCNATYGISGNPDYCILTQSLNLPYGLLWYPLRMCFMNMIPQVRESSINWSAYDFFFMCMNLLPPTLILSLGFSSMWVYHRPTIQSVLQCHWILNYGASPPEPMETFRQHWNAYIGRRNGTVKAWANIFHPPQQETN